MSFKQESFPVNFPLTPEEGVEILRLLQSAYGGESVRDHHDLMGHVIGGALLSPEREGEGGSDVKESSSSLNSISKKYTSIMRWGPFIAESLIIG